MSFEEAYNEFKIYAQNRHKKQGFYTLIHDFNLYICPYFNKYDLKCINKLIINNWKDYILNFKFSSSYNKKLFYSLNSFFKYCVSYMYLDLNPMHGIDNFKNDIRKINHNIYTLKEFKKFYKRIDNYVIKEFFHFSYFYGTRSRETLALKFSDIEGLSISIHKNLQRRGKREIDTTKNISSIRTIDISFITWIKLFKLYNYYVLKYGIENDFYIFGGVKPLSTSTIDRIKHKTCLKYNLKEITVHEFRHSYATRMIHKNVPIDIVSRSLGHSNVSTTLDIYVHNEKKTCSVFSSRLKIHTLIHDFNPNIFKHF